MEKTIFHKYLEFTFNNLGSLYSPMEWLEVDLALSKTEIIILLLLDRASQLKVSDISRQLNMPLSTTTSIIDRLEQKQLVERTRSMKDRRVVIVRLTEKGDGLCRDIMVKFEMMFKNILAKLTKNLSAEEMEFLKRIIAKII
ncbi:MarR family winged helix-turn-helix transcriptional regulator [Desulfoscipio gibsoniae]|uniref:Transcriptional regulator n=1 Tax=Desulfoscipio gibsoniae DSM 7213 TaxID=767817 RepID=R4KIN2_9FIRM|nr:MarR family transcriptional regulator [Desulfoscipio gibsoniae]AGL03043.1 transcriptional regulator [Desulfoscipio gibsoniae DSM 7213]